MTTHSLQTSVITLASAARLRDSVIAHAAANGWSVAAVVLDPGGAVVTLAKMDGVADPILEIATDKALTATPGKITRAFFERKQH